MFISPLSSVFPSQHSSFSPLLPTLEIAELEGLIAKNVSGEREALDTETRQQILRSLSLRINRRRYVCRLKPLGYLSCCRQQWVSALK
jgi:hypothetical protein